VKGEDVGPDSPVCALAWSGGKDSTLALHRSLREGRRITHLFTIYDRESGRVPYHGVGRDLIEAQARALGLEAVLEPCAEGAFEIALGRVFGRLHETGVEAVVFGNIHLADVRAWYEERVRAAGFDHIEPLWGGDPGRIAREFVALGYRSRVVSVLLETADPDWLGRDFDAELLARIEARQGVDPCGERGEFHSFTVDGPAFLRPVPVRETGRGERNGYRYLDLESDGADSRAERDARA